MDDNYNIKLILEAQDKASAEIKKMQKSIAELQGQTTKATQNMSSSFSKFAQTSKQTFQDIRNVWAVAFVALTLAIKGFVKQSMEAETQQMRLTTILRNSRGASDADIAWLNAQADALEKVWVVSKSVITRVQAQIATFDRTADTIKVLTPAFLDYIVAEKWMWVSAEEAEWMTKSLAQALQGNFASLSKQGFVMDKATKALIASGDETQRAEWLVSVLNSTYRDFNELATKTSQWALQNLTNQYNNMSQSIGDALMPVLIDLVNKIAPIIADIREWVDENPKLTATIIEIALAGAGLMIVAWTLWTMLPTLATWFAFLTWPIGLTIIGMWLLVTAMNKFYDMLPDYWVQITNVEIQLKNLNDEYKKWKVPVEDYKTKTAELSDELERLKKEAMTPMWQAITNLWQTFWWLWKNPIAYSKKVLWDFADAMVECFKVRWEALADIRKNWGSVATRLRNWPFKMIADWFNWLVDWPLAFLVEWVQWIWQVFGDVFWWIVDFLGPIFDWIDNKIGKVLKRAWTLSTKTYSPQITPASYALEQELAKVPKITPPPSTVRGADTNPIWETDYWAKWKVAKISEEQKALESLAESMKKYWYSEETIQKNLLTLKQANVDKIEETGEYFDLLKTKVQDSYDKINDSIKESYDKIFDYKQQIIDLNAEIDKLWWEKSKDVAREYVNIQAEIVAKTKEIAELTKDLNAKASDWWVTQKERLAYEEAMLIKVQEQKALQDSLASAFKWLTDQEKIDMQAKIDEQTKYNAMNSIEKIQEDYRLKKVEIQSEIDLKLKAISDEQAKVVEYNTQRKLLQASRMWQLAIDHSKQIAMYQELINQARILASMKWGTPTAINTWATGWVVSKKADWGGVFGGTQYLVWEEWPELFVPRTGWTIVPNERITNNSPININVNWLSVRTEADIDAIANALARKIELRRNFSIS